MSHTIATTAPLRSRSVDDDPPRAEHLAELLKAVAHPLRIRIVALLCNGPLHVNAMADRLGVDQALVSQHLRILRMRHLVRAVRRDGFAFYELAEPQLQSLVSCLDGCSIR